MACIVSFRTLFVHKEQQQSDAKEAEARRRQVEDQSADERRMRQPRHDSLLHTCSRTCEAEGRLVVEDSDLSLLGTSMVPFRLPKPASGRFSIDFSRESEGSSGHGLFI